MIAIFRVRQNFRAAPAATVCIFIRIDDRQQHFIFRAINMELNTPEYTTYSCKLIWNYA